MREQTMILRKVKETKNTVRYDSDEDVLVPAIYLQKSHLLTPYSEKIRVTVKEG